MNVNNLVLTTDTPIDQVIFMASGSFVATSGVPTVQLVPHGLPFRPLLVGTWSLDPNFSTSFDTGFAVFSGPTNPQLNMQSTPTDVRMIPIYNSGPPITFYWRAFGLMPSTVNSDAVPTADISNDFVFNTEFNYTKLLYNGVLSWASGTTAITHNLGYRPQVDVWFEQTLNATLLSKFNMGLDTTYTGTDNVRVTDTQVLFDFNDFSGTPGRQWFYRVYADTGVGI